MRIARPAFCLGAVILQPWLFAAQTSRDSLQKAITSDLRIAKVDAKGALGQMGTPFQTKIAGLRASAAGRAPEQNHYRNGAIERSAGSTGDFVTLKAGETVYPERVTVETDSISFLLVKASGGPAAVSRALLVVHFPSGFLDTATPKQVMDKVAAVIERSDRQPAKSNRENITPSTTSNLTGKTVQEMTEVLGNNFTTVISGKRTIYVYKELGLRIPVENGKVVSGL